MDLIYLFVGLILGALGTWLIAKSKYSISNSIDPKSFQELDKQNAILEQQLNDSRQIVVRSEEELKQLRGKINFLSSEKAALTSDHKSLQERMAEHKSELDALQLQMKEQFQNIAADIVFKNSQRIQEEHKDKLNDILTPLRDKIEKFETQVKYTHEERFRASSPIDLFNVCNWDNCSFID